MQISTINIEYSLHTKISTALTCARSIALPAGKNIHIYNRKNQSQIYHQIFENSPYNKENTATCTKIATQKLDLIFTSVNSLNLGNFSML